MKKIILTILFIAVLAPPKAAAKPETGLYLAPSSGAYTIGETIALGVFIRTEARINAGQAKIIFSPERLRLISISKSGSIFKFWAEEPVFSNEEGSVSFAGGLPTPGYSGSAGKIITLVFRAVSSGRTEVKFSSGAVLADDGKGTNLLSAFGQGAYLIEPKKIAPPPPEEAKPIFAPAKLKIKIEARRFLAELWERFLGGEIWTNKKHVRFSWDLAKDITAVAYIFDGQPQTDPQAIYNSPPREAVYENIKDGIWYFHIKAKNRAAWGEISHEKIKIDSLPPESFEILVDNGGDPTNPSPKLLFKARDAPSGVDHFEVKIDDKNFVTVDGDSYTLPALPPGKHAVLGLVVDRAGNQLLKTEEIEIAAIRSPVITLYPNRLHPDELLSLGGTSEGGSIVHLYLETNGKTDYLGETCACRDHQWSFVYRGQWQFGQYKVWGIAEDQRGAKSLPGAKAGFQVVPLGFITLGPWKFDLHRLVRYLFAFNILLLVMIIFETFFIAARGRLKNIFRKK